MIDDVINQQTHLLIPLLLIMIATTVIRTIVRYSYQLYLNGSGKNTPYDLREDQKLQELDFDFQSHSCGRYYGTDDW